MNKEKSCGAIIYKKINNQITYLLIRSKTGHHWSYPKGHVEGKETEIETALREIKEETNLEPVLDPNFRLMVTYSPKIGVLKDVIYFIGQVSENQKVTVQDEEVISYKWLSYGEALKMVTHENEKNVLIEANKYLHQKGVK